MRPWTVTGPAQSLHWLISASERLWVHLRVESSGCCVDTSLLRACYEPPAACWYSRLPLRCRMLCRSRTAVVCAGHPGRDGAAAGQGGEGACARSRRAGAGCPPGRREPAAPRNEAPRRRHARVPVPTLPLSCHACCADVQRVWRPPACKLRPARCLLWCPQEWRCCAAVQMAAVTRAPD